MSYFVFIMVVSNTVVVCLVYLHSGVVGIIIYPRMINAGSLSNVEQSVISCPPSWL